MSKKVNSVLIVGPQDSCKTAIANSLGETFGLEIYDEVVSPEELEAHEATKDTGIFVLQLDHCIFLDTGYFDLVIKTNKLK